MQRRVKYDPCILSNDSLDCVYDGFNRWWAPAFPVILKIDRHHGIHHGIISRHSEWQKIVTEGLCEEMKMDVWRY